MGQMKWIYTMVQDGSYSIFKTMYETAFKNDVDSFTFENMISLLNNDGFKILNTESKQEYTLKNFLNWYFTN